MPQMLLEVTFTCKVCGVKEVIPVTLYAADATEPLSYLIAIAEASVRNMGWETRKFEWYCPNH